MSRRPTVWVRRCASCGDDDLHAAFGDPSIIGAGPWSCRGCGMREWVAASLVLPDDARGVCPNARGLR